MKILVGSHNPVKIDAAKEAFGRFFNDVEVIGHKVPSGVREQPIGDEETFQGARNRAHALVTYNKQKSIVADYCVGIEGGIFQLNHTWYDSAVFCILNNKKEEGLGLCPFFSIPTIFVDRLLHGGAELGPLTDELTGSINSKQKEGTVGILTRGVVTRKDFYVPGIIMALIPFFNRSLYV